MERNAEQSLLYRCFETLAIVVFIVMLISTILQVLTRYVLQIPMMWTEELARLLAVSVTYLGSVVVWIKRKHIRVDFIEERLPPRVRFYVGVVVNLLMGWFMVTLVIGCYRMTGVTWSVYAASMPWLPMGYVYTVVGLSAAAIVWLIFQDLFTAFSSALRGRSHLPGLARKGSEQA